MTARIVIIGGGSAYMPGIAFALASGRESFADATLVLQDIDADAVDLQRRLTGGIFRSRGAGDIRVEAQTDRLRAMDGADLVLTAFRPGGLEARRLDEQIAIDHGVIGQETAGPGGFAMALRSVPIVLDIAGELKRVGAPGAVLLNYTNPVQIVSEAMTAFSPDTPFLGLCDQTSGEAGLHAEMLGVNPHIVELDTAGTNHMTFTSAVRAEGRDVTAQLWARYGEAAPEDLPTGGKDDWWKAVRLFRLLGRFPSEYMKYFFFHDDVLASMRAAGRTRAEDVMAILPAVLESYRREADAAVPNPSMARASEEHGDFAVSIMATMLGGRERRFVLNLPNTGQVQDLPLGAVVETPALISGRTWRPIEQGALPTEVSGLVRQVAASARLTAEAAVTGDRALAVKALAVHPLVRGIPHASSLVYAYLAAHAQHLPRSRC